MGLTQKQVERLLTPVRASRVEQVRNNSYVPHQEIRAELTRIFGPGNWDSKVFDVTLLYEQRDDREVVDSKTGEVTEKTYWTVGYRAAVELNVRDYFGNPVASFVEYHAEENAPQPNRGEAHALCLTSVESYALRRAAIGLGDALGLHLYNKGSLRPIVGGTLMLVEVFGMTQQEAAEATLTDEQMAALQTTLGAQPVSESPNGEAEAGTPAEPEGATA